jgi:hypothetical protein
MRHAVDLKDDIIHAPSTSPNDGMMAPRSPEILTEQGPCWVQTDMFDTE